jgi:hypothetical protein
MMDLHPAEVRQLVLQTFEEFGVAASGESEMSETVRVDCGKYVARCYRLEGLFAMWLIVAGIVQFYDAEGNMLRTVSLWQERVPYRSAA